MTDADLYAPILALRRRLAELEKAAATAAQPPPADKPGFGEALAELRRSGSASGPAIDALRQQITEGPTPPAAPSRDQLAEAARVMTADLRGAPTIEEAFSDMQRRASRRDAIEGAQAGGLGRVDPLDGPTSRAIDKLDKILKGR